METPIKTLPWRRLSRSTEWWSAIAASVLLLCFAAAPAAAEEPKPTFFRGLNLNGPPLVIDGQKWEGKDATNYSSNDHKLDRPTVDLKPGTDRNRARMIRTSLWGNSVDITLRDVPNGKYTVFVFVWEDNNAVDFQLSINGKGAGPRYYSRSAGVWERLGPFVVDVTEDKIRVQTSGGDANISGIEVWSGVGKVPKPKLKLAEIAAAESFSPEGIEFFEKKIRPLLSKHCYECHSAESGELAGGLLLDSRPGMLKGGDTEPSIVPGSPEESLLIAAVRHDDHELKMPPDGKLSAQEIADLTEWIKQGAPDPRNKSALAKGIKTIDWNKAREFWSLRPVVDPRVPAVKDEAWPRTPIDRFILAKLEAAGMSPAPLVDKRTLIRRATFDLTGLPPTPEEIEAFLADDSPLAWKRQIGRLLSSPHYGERWGRHWLDLVRYADTSGCNSDFPVPTAYLYRNYVIESFNADVPYDRFIQEQIAGDLLPHASDKEQRRQIIATGYLAIGRRFGSLADEFHLTIEDSIDNLGKVVLGLSVSCARCHDHKFDPILARDYYALYGIFESTKYAFPGTEIPPQPKDFVPLVSPEVWKNEIAPLEKQLADEQKEVERLNKRKEEIRKGEFKPKEDETPPTLEEATAEWEAARKRRDEAAARIPKDVLAYAVSEGNAADTRLQKKGEPKYPGEVASRGFPQILGGQKLPEDYSGSGRLQLAQWLTDPANPLTARVVANRLWQYHFGQGLVRTPNDFGARGAAPTHPELLDYLASRLVEGNWSLKKLHKQIMLSSAYQMACYERPEYRERDPRNELWWTFQRRRLSAEEFRDALLAASGDLDRTPGGAHPFPPAPLKFTQHNPFIAVYETKKRSVYLMQQRIKKHPWLEVFDGADPNATTPTRPLNTTPIQALFALNDPLVHRQAEALAARLLRESSDSVPLARPVPDEPARINRAFALTVGHAPTPEALESSKEYLKQVRAALVEAGTPADKLEQAAWSSLCRALFCASEFSFVD